MDPPLTGLPDQDASKPYHCSVCGDDFKRHEHLIRHSRRHTQEKPFKCDVCLKEFARRDILSRHAIVHVPAAERAALPQKTQKRGTKRVQQACNNCAKGKCRCDGETPCSTCQSKGLENCEYTMSSTPAKRKRADSSASTAAANVLLQVASSAHASPKGDWTMDYNGHQGDASMQPPQPIVFGYQPTLNGSVHHDPFIYGASRPGSRFASRAPSPSHDFEAQFESALPAASVFAFLFKETAKDLPGINSILPRILPIPGFPTDFQQVAYPHGTPDQPGIYSNYRNDSMSNSGAAAYNNLTRPPSPVLSFPELEIPEAFLDLEESPLVDTFTETDRTHLQDYIQLQLPSARLINILIQLYFERFHPSLPILHQANYAPGQIEHIVTLAIMAIGAQYFGKESLGELHYPLVILGHRVLKLEQETFPALQAQFLLALAELYNLQSPAALESAEERRSSLLRRARARRLFDENYDDSPPDNASTQTRWQILRGAEERRRLSWAIWMYDNLFTVFFGVRALMEVNEIRTSLPCHENLWNASTAHEWADQFAPDRLPLRTRTLWSTGRLEDRGLAECAQYGTFCRTILAFVEARRVHDIASAVPSVDETDEGETQRSLRLDAEAVLSNAKDMSDKAFNLLEEILSSPESSPEPETTDSLLSLQFARMITTIDLKAVRKFLVDDARTIQQWAAQGSADARSAALSAAHINALMRDHQSSPFAGMMSFYATVTLLCFAKFYPSNDSLQQLQLDSHKFGSQQAQQWINTGNFIPIVEDIGVLDQANIARITKLWDTASEAFEWGYSSLKARIESLEQYS